MGSNSGYVLWNSERLATLLGGTALTFTVIDFVNVLQRTKETIPYAQAVDVKKIFAIIVQYFLAGCAPDDWLCNF